MEYQPATNHELHLHGAELEDVAEVELPKVRVVERVEGAAEPAWRRASLDGNRRREGFGRGGRVRVWNQVVDVAGGGLAGARRLGDGLHGHATDSFLPRAA